MKKLFLFLTAALFSVGTWAADPDLVIGETSQTSSTFLKEYSTEGITISSDQSYGSGAVQLGNTPSGSSAYNANYLQVLATSDIDSIYFLMSGNGSNKTLQAPVFGWTTTATSNSASTYYLPSAQTSSANSYAAAVWFKYDLTTVGVKCARLYRATKNISSANPSYTGSSTQLGNGNTIKIYGMKIWLHPAAAHTVTYKANGGTGADIVAQANKVASCSFTAPTGKIFAGWNTQADGNGTAYAVNAAVTTDLTLFAQWEDLVTASFNLQGHGDAIEAQELAKGSKVTEPDAPFAVGYNFGGWYKEEACSNAWNFASDVVNSNTTLYAKWTEATQCTNLVFATSGDSPTAAGQAILLQAGSNGGNVITAGAKDGKYSTSFQYNTNGLSMNGGGADSVRVTLFSNMQAGTAIVAEITNSHGDTKSRGFKLQTSSKSNKATWATTEAGTKIYYYVVTAGDGLAGSNVFIIARSETATLKSLKVYNCGDALETHTITFNSDGGSSVGSIEVLDGTKAYQPISPTKDGYAFAGWYNGEVAYNWSSNVTSDLALTAHWNQLYTITYVIGEATGTAPTETSKIQGAKFTVADASSFVAPDGYDFDKWNDGKNDYLPGAEYTVGTADVTLTAVWKDALTVTYYDGANVIGTEKVVENGHPAKYSSLATMYTGFADFGGWYSDSELETSVADMSAEVITTNKAYYAKFTNKNHATSVNFEQFVLDNSKKGNVKSYLSTNGYTYTIGNSDILDSLTYAKRESDRNLPYLGLKIKDENGEVSFLLQANTALNIKLGNTPGAVTLKFGDEDAVAAKDTAYAGSTCDIVVKIKTNTGSTLVIKQIMVGEALETVVLPAIVTFDDGEGTCATTELKYTGTALTLPSATAPEGMKFDGWYDKATSGTLVGIADAEYVPTTDVTLYAYYSEATAIDNTNKEVKAIKRIENGQVVIFKDGKYFNVLGIQIR